MVLNGRKLLIGLILVLACILSVMALSRIILSPTEPAVPSTAVNNASKQTADSGSYFAEHRIVRERNRSRQIELLEKLINNERIDSQSKSRAARDLLTLTENSERERLAEETVKALGYKDCVVLLRENAALAVIAADSIPKNREQVLAGQLADVLRLNVERITVMARPEGKN